MLDVVQPAECVGEGNLLEVHQLAEMVGDGQEHDDIGGGNVGADEEHFHLKMSVQVFAHGVPVEPQRQLNERKDLESLLALYRREEHLIKIGRLGQLHHA